MNLTPDFLEWWEEAKAEAMTYHLPPLESHYSPAEAQEYYDEGRPPSHLAHDLLERMEEEEHYGPAIND